MAKLHQACKAPHTTTFLGVTANLTPQNPGASAKFPAAKFTLANLIWHEIPCILGDPQTKWDKIRIGCLTTAISGAQKRADMLHPPPPSIFAKFVVQGRHQAYMQP